jgi:hypothetical protein
MPELPLCPQSGTMDLAPEKTESNCNFLDIFSVKTWCVLKKHHCLLLPYISGSFLPFDEKN